MQSQQIARPNGFWYVTGAATIWGTIGVATQAIYTLDHASSLFINLARMIIASAALMAACWFVVGHGMFTIKRRDFMLMALNGVFLAISQAAYFVAIHSTGVAITTLLTVCAAPVIVTCFAVLLKFERLNVKTLGALACAIVGSVLLVGRHGAIGQDYDIVTGTLLSLVSAVTYACMIICGRFLAADYHPLQVMTITFAAGSVVLAVMGSGSGLVPIGTEVGWLLVLYLGLVPTAIAYLMFQRGLRSVSATTASVVTLLEPMVATILAWAIFGETLALTGIVGAVLLLCSITVLSRNSPA